MQRSENVSDMGASIVDCDVKLTLLQKGHYLPANKADVKLGG